MLRLARRPILTLGLLLAAAVPACPARAAPPRGMGGTRGGMLPPSSMHSMMMPAGMPMFPTPQGMVSRPFLPMGPGMGLYSSSVYSMPGRPGYGSVGMGGRSDNSGGGSRREGPGPAAGRPGRRGLRRARRGDGRTAPARRPGRPGAAALPGRRPAGRGAPPRRGDRRRAGPPRAAARAAARAAGGGGAGVGRRGGGGRGAAGAGRGDGGVAADPRGPGRRWRANAREFNLDRPVEELPTRYPAPPTLPLHCHWRIHRPCCPNAVREVRSW
jgi:translation initiation factor IF-2